MFKKSYLIFMLTISMLLMSALPALALTSTQNATFTVASSFGITSGDPIAFNSVNQGGFATVSLTTPTDLTNSFFQITGSLPSTDVTVKADMGTSGWALDGTNFTPVAGEIALTFAGSSPLISTETNIPATAVSVKSATLSDGFYGGTMKLYAGTAGTAPTGVSKTIILTWEAIQ